MQKANGCIIFAIRLTILNLFLQFFYFVESLQKYLGRVSLQKGINYFNGMPFVEYRLNETI